jgi:hypothetical protein
MIKFVYCDQLGIIRLLDVEFHSNDVEAWYADVATGRPIDLFWVESEISVLSEKIYRCKHGTPKEDITHKVNLRYFLNQLIS